MKSNIKLSVFCLAGLATSGCFGFEGKDLEVCMVSDGLMLPGVPQDPALGDIPLATSVSFSHDEGDMFRELANAGVNTQLRLGRTTLVAKEQMQSFSFLDSMQLFLGSEAENSELPNVEVISCLPGQCAFERPELTAISTEGPNLTDYLVGGPVVFTVDVAGRLPEQDWGVGVEVCINAEVAYGASAL